MILSLSRTTAAFEARRKSVTRREWADVYYERIKRKYEAAIAGGERGLKMQAWSASPHRGGKKIGIILVTEISREPTRDIPDTDWEAEGFAYMEEHDIDLGPEMSCVKQWRLWRQHPDLITSVVRFDILELECEKVAA